MGLSGGCGRLGRFARFIGLGIICLGLANCASTNVASHSEHKSRTVATAAKQQRGPTQVANHRADCDSPPCSTGVSNSRMSVVARASYASVDYGAVVGSRPAGCPHQFCGCEASRYVFGKVRPELNLASNWAKFPRSTPASGMVAVRNHHVMVLIRHEGGKNWLVHDGNSGKGLTREHVRSISGYIIVNPHST